MDPEEEIYHQPEFWGDFPQIPQWEAVTDEVIVESTESVIVCHQSDFEKEFQEGYI